MNSKLNLMCFQKKAAALHDAIAKRINMDISQAKDVTKQEHQTESSEYWSDPNNDRPSESGNEYQKIMECLKKSRIITTAKCTKLEQGIIACKSDELVLDRTEEPQQDTPSPGDDASNQMDSLENEVMIQVSFYKPRNPNDLVGKFRVFGTQTLLDIRHSFFCASDILHLESKPFDVLNTQSMDSLEHNQKRSKKSFFFIENCFYLEEYNPSSSNNDSYIKTLVNWMNGVILNSRSSNVKSLTDLSVFAVKAMSDVRFIDLEISFKKKYLFVHDYGECGHSFSFDNATFFNVQYDSQNRYSYPHKLLSHTYVALKCMVCDINTTSMVTIDDTFVPHNPCTWCESCFKLFHCRENGDLIYDQFKCFKVNLDY